jgi:hypothetical protein
MTLDCGEGRSLRSKVYQLADHDHKRRGTATSSIYSAVLLKTIVNLNPRRLAELVGYQNEWMCEGRRFTKIGQEKVETST